MNATATADRFVTMDDAGFDFLAHAQAQAAEHPAIRELLAPARPARPARPAVPAPPRAAVPVAPLDAIGTPDSNVIREYRDADGWAVVELRVAL